jgi:hypothetical protein
MEREQERQQTEQREPEQRAEQRGERDQSQGYGRDPQRGERQEFEQPGQRQQSQTMERGSSHQGNGGLIGGQQMERYSSQWTSIQAAFVDEPRKAVEQADRLVEEIIQNLSKTFSEERRNLEGQWSRGDKVSTEDLRVALQRYRQFFQSLLRG